MKQFRRIASLILVVICFSFSVSASAIGMPVNERNLDAVNSESIASSINAISSNLSEATLLDETQIKSLVECQIDSYIETEKFADNKHITPGDVNTWIPLHDLQGNHFADIVPLIDSDFNEIGYITMGAIEDGFTHYMMEWDVSLLDTLRAALDNNCEAQAVFFPPMDYGIYYRNEQQRIYKYDMRGRILVDVTNEIVKNVETLSKQYQIIRSAENKLTTEQALLYAKTQTSGAGMLSEKGDTSSNMKEQISNQAAVTKEDVRLSCEWKNTTSFLPVTKDGKTYYGGDQNWFEFPFFSYNSCGSVAAANVLAYMGTEDKKYSNLYPFETIQYDDFYQFMKLINLYYVRPGAAGILTLDYFIDQVELFATDYGTPLTSARRAATASRTQCATTIKKGLSSDKPVAALNLAYGTDFDYEWHWVTITKYFQSTDNTRWIAISTWGERRSVNWDLYWKYANEASKTSGGYVYFY